MSECSGASLRIIGVGNAFRHDDGAGLLAAQEISKRLGACPGIAVRTMDGEGTALMDAWQDAEAVILIDAVASGAEPGTLHGLDALDRALPDHFFSCSSHSFGVAEAIALARTLDQLPTRLVIYGIEGQNFSPGIGLSEAVERAVTTVVERVLSQEPILKSVPE